MNYLKLFLLCIVLSINSGVNAAFQPQGVNPAEQVVITEKGGNSSEIKKQQANTNPNQAVIKERKMFKPSKVKGFSKLALWTAIGLIVILGLVIFLLTKSKKTALRKQQEMFEHTKKLHYGFDHSAPESSTNKTAARIGYEFEKFVVDLFPTSFYRIKFWTSDKSSNNHVCAVSNQYPDLLVELTKNGTKYPFAVECKYRSNLYETGFELGEKQLANYRQFESENDVLVFIAIGIAGSPSNPKELYVIPLSSVTSNIIPVSQLKIWYRPHNGGLFYNEKDKTLKIWNKSSEK
jgi:hypothetical protein